MGWNRSLIVAMIVSGAHVANAAEPAPPSRGPLLARRAPPEKRTTHVDYAALSAAVVLFGLGYAVALSAAAQKNFAGDSGRLAAPLIGPWLSKPSWGWTLDGLVQLGGAAFMVDAYANPVTVLGTPEARLQTPADTGQHLVRVMIRF